MNEPQQREVECVDCKKDFRINIKIRPLNTDNDIEVTYFDCPHCLREYISCYTDSSIRRLRGKVQKAHAKIGNAKYDQAAASKMLGKLKKKLGADMDNLRAQVEAGN
ncbi:hypothetical protein M5X00_31770 [Paenibacillus alvei]|uniref:Transglycosylase n=1 Tax=Paenibacillus alvei TaxID=44250 RepID=A0ABT4H7P8_PAEAL|nr:hypothetical protein [Paenibacillus alvei]MCY9545230.1 hypothetical protein [Paenibacillus alvei]MCY9708782.1 hypothetical protein [Paenibacillus alvei]MCY9738378.1 hypothetical protein [Paenibacillus alvei]MCY9758797.1 hypothetical protein [Paenibacillus alvei]MCY9764989.1 hypothetical protein [Paenibacillus alvei]